MHRLIRRTGLGLLVALALAVTGCASDDGGGDADPPAAPSSGAPAADPKLALASSTDALNQESFKMEMTMGDLMTATGAVDAAAGAGTVSMTIVAQGSEVTFETIFTGTDVWANFGELGAMLGVETEWMHIDQAQLPEGGFMGVEPGKADLANAAGLLEGLGTVEQTGENTFEGEIDLTKASSATIDEQTIAAMGEEASALPFTATVDDQGRLTELVIDFPDQPELPADTLQVRYFDFGTEVDVTPPPADEVSEMPAELYAMFQN